MKIEIESLRKKPTIVELFSDNGEHSGWELCNTDNGEILWSEDDEYVNKQKSITVNFLKEWHLFIQKKQMPILVSEAIKSESDEIVGMNKGDFIIMEQAYDLFLKQL